MKHLNFLFSFVISFSVFLISCEKDELNPEPVASFTISKTLANTNETISFTNSSENAINYSWNFGDGNTSTDQSPTHSYSTTGTFTITLTAIGEGGKNNSSKTITISYPEPVASFTMDKTEAETGKTITFTNTSQNASSYSWDFGDGNTSTDQSPTHSYSSDGTFTVTLTATGDGGENSASKTVTITKSSLIGKWNITGGTFNGSTISDLSGYRLFGTDDITDWDGNSRCSMTQGSDRGTVYGAFKLDGNTIKYGSNMTNIYWVNNTLNFSKFGVVGLGLQDVTYSISGNVLTITGENKYGTTVLTYEKE